MPYIDDSLVNAFAAESPSLSSSIGQASNHLTPAPQTSVSTCIPLKNSGHRQLLIATLHNTSSIALAVDDVWATDIDGNCLSSIYPTNKDGSTNKDGGRDVRDVTWPAIVGVPEELTADGKWCGVIDISKLCEERKNETQALLVCQYL